jgi:hypothetical protein
MNYILLGVLVFVIGVATLFAVPIVRSMHQEAVEQRRSRQIWDRPKRHSVPSRHHVLSLKTRRFIKLLASGATAKQVEKALRHGADPNAPDRDGRTPLATAAARCSPEVITARLRAGADIHHKEMRPWRLLPIIVQAALNPDPKVMVTLLKAGADPNQRDGAGYPPLVSWFRWGREARDGKISEEMVLRVVSNLLKAGAKPVDFGAPPYLSVRNLLGLEAERRQEFTTDEEVAKLIKGDGTL